MKIYNIDTETVTGSKRYDALMKTDSWLFQACEKIWNDWFDDAIKHNSEIEDMYYSDDAIYTKKGAIRGMIEQIFECMNEENLPFIYLNDNRLDLTCNLS